MLNVIVSPFVLVILQRILSLLVMDIWTSWTGNGCAGIDAISRKKFNVFPTDSMPHYYTVINLKDGRRISLGAITAKWI